MVDFKNFKFLNRVYINTADKGEVGSEDAQPLMNFLLAKGIVLSQRLVAKMLQNEENISEFIAQATGLYGQVLFVDIKDRDYELLDYYAQDPKYYERCHISPAVEAFINAKEIEKELPKEVDSGVELDLITEKELKKYLVSLANSQSTWTGDEKRVFLKYYKKIDNFFFNNSRNLYDLLQSMGKADRKEFSKAYVVKKLEDLRIIICAVLNIAPSTKNPWSRDVHYPQWLKTLTMEAIDRLALFVELKSEIAKNKEFWNFVQYKITPTGKRYEKYRNAVQLLEIPAIKKAKSIESQITNGSFDSFEHEFQTYYNYNRGFAFRNLLPIYARWGSINEDLLLRFAPRNVKSVLDCIKAINKAEIEGEKSVYHFGDKIYTKEAQERADYFKLRVQLVKLLKKTLKGLNYKRFKGKKVYLDQSCKNTALPLNNRNTLAIEQYLPRGTILPLGDKTKGVRLFCAWKRKDNEIGNQRLEVQLNIGGKKVNRDNFQHFDAVKFSGDHLSCFKFDEANPIINATFYDIDLESIDSDVVFSVAQEAGVKFRDYDIFVGATTNLDIYDLKFINLNGAEILAQQVTPTKDLVVLKFIKETNSLQFLGIPYNESNEEDTSVIASIYSNIKGLTYYDFLTMLVNDDSAFVDSAKEADIIVTNGRLRQEKVLNLCDLDLEIKELIHRELK